MVIESGMKCRNGVGDDDSDLCCDAASVGCVIASDGFCRVTYEATDD